MISAKKAAVKAERRSIRREKRRAKRERREIRERAIKEINEAIRHGAPQTAFSCTLDESTKEYLRKRGYTVEDAGGRWGNKYIVKWGKIPTKNGGLIHDKR